MSRFADIAIFVSMLFSLAAHAGAHYSKGGLGLRGALLCVGVPVISAVMAFILGRVVAPTPIWLGACGDSQLADGAPPRAQ